MSERRVRSEVKYPGILGSDDGSGAVVSMETAASEAAGAYPITPSTQMGEGWAAAVAEGVTNVNGRSLIFFEPEGEHAAAAVTAGMSMTGLRAANFSSGQGVAYMHEALYAAKVAAMGLSHNLEQRVIFRYAHTDFPADEAADEAAQALMDLRAKVLVSRTLVIAD